MENQTPSLGDALAGLRHTVQAPREKCVFLPAPIQAVIAAIFARIFGRLEQILLLWQAGQLPAPQPREPREAAARPTPVARSGTRHSLARHPSARQAPDSIQPPARARRAITHRAAPANPRGTSSAPPAAAPHPARCRRTGQNPGFPRSPSHSHFVTISKLIIPCPPAPSQPTLRI